MTPARVPHADATAQEISRQVAGTKTAKIRWAGPLWPICLEAAVCDAAMRPSSPRPKRLAGRCGLGVAASGE